MRTTATHARASGPGVVAGAAKLVVGQGPQRVCQRVDVDNEGKPVSPARKGDRRMLLLSGDARPSTIGIGLGKKLYKKAEL